MACRLCFGDSGGPCCSFGTDAPPRRDPFAKAVGDDAAAAAVSRHTGAVSAVGTRMPTARAEGHTQPLNSLRNHCVDTEGAPDEFIAYATAAVRHDLPQRLVRLHDEDPCCVPIFRDMYSGGDELAHAVGQTGGALACAKHVLERGACRLRSCSRSCHAYSPQLLCCGPSCPIERCSAQSILKHCHVRWCHIQATRF
eukprot:SAG31_NODE_740_length_12438_cov_10.788719_10_plen_197_part_00